MRLIRADGASVCGHSQPATTLAPRPPVCPTADCVPHGAVHTEVLRHHAGRPSDPWRGVDPVFLFCSQNSDMAAIAHMCSWRWPPPTRRTQLPLHRRVANWEKRIKALADQIVRKQAAMRGFSRAVAERKHFEDGSKWNKLFVKRAPRRIWLPNHLSMAEQLILYLFYISSDCGLNLPLSSKCSYLRIITATCLLGSVELVSSSLCLVTLIFSSCKLTFQAFIYSQCVEVCAAFKETTVFYAFLGKWLIYIR